MISTVITHWHRKPLVCSHSYFSLYRNNCKYRHYSKFRHTHTGALAFPCLIRPIQHLLIPMLACLPGRCCRCIRCPQRLVTYCCRHCNLQAPCHSRRTWDRDHYSLPFERLYGYRPSLGIAYSPDQSCHLFSCLLCLCRLHVSPVVNCRHLVPFSTTGQRLT
ncbi:hypothetical protein LCGC14_2247540 [marine sediment metagenome]|uniref:Uncharacterized protein n=1 Tax=marine sediment metagenome TaxID=412755 RepID=A0A0F9FG37_9ZZZZ